MSYHIFERWPFTSLQNMNLDWLLTAMKEAVTKANLAQQESFTAQTTAVNAQSAAAAAQDTADMANLRAATAQSTATNALDDYLDVEIVLSSSIPAEADKNVDDIMTAYAAGKKIRFYLQDVRNSTILVSYDFKIIIPTAGSTDTHILVLFDNSFSSSTYNAIVADFAKTSGTYSLSVMDIAGGGGGGVANAVLYVAQTLTAQQQAQARDNIGAGTVQIIWGYQDEDDQGRSVIRRKSDDTIYTTARMLADESAGKLVLVESPHGIYYMGAVGSFIASFYNGSSTFMMLVQNDGQYTEVARPEIPSFTTADAGKFYRVNSTGTAAGWETVPAAESNSFGGV